MHKPSLSALVSAPRIVLESRPGQFQLTLRRRRRRRRRSALEAVGVQPPSSSHVGVMVLAGLRRIL